MGYPKINKMVMSWAPERPKEMVICFGLLYSRHVNRLARSVGDGVMWHQVRIVPSFLWSLISMFLESNQEVYWYCGKMQPRGAPNTVTSPDTQKKESADGHNTRWLTEQIILAQNKTTKNDFTDLKNDFIASAKKLSVTSYSWVPASMATVF